MKLTWTTFKAMNTPTEWRARFMRNKWILAWAGATSLFGYMVYVAVAQADKPWQGAVLQTMGTAIPIYAAILIYLQSKAAGDKATREQIDHLQRLNQQEIEAMTALFQRQMDHLSEQTNRQIMEYSRETLKVVSKLEENSLLLGEMLKRNLEESIGDFDERIADVERDLHNASSWKLLRTSEEKSVQLAHRRSKLEQLSNWRNYLYNKYERLRGMFMHNNHLEP